MLRRVCGQEAQHIGLGKLGRLTESAMLSIECRLQARQGVAHGHFQVNGRTVNIPSYQVSAGDVITVKNRPSLKELYAQLVQSAQSYDCAWISMDKDELKAVITTVPGPADISLPVNSGVVVAFLAR